MTHLGNHDITLDEAFYAQHGLYFHNQEPQDQQKCQDLLEHSSSIIYLKHESAHIKLQSPSGPQTHFTIFGSPYSPAKGLWAFGYNPEEAQGLWEQIPLDMDIVVTHTPPKYHCDEAKERRALGCEILRNQLWRIRPRLLVCGHVHESRGSEIVRWGLLASNIKYKEDGTDRWIDPGRDNKKMSHIDLTPNGGNLFENDGSTSKDIPEDFKPTSPTRITTSALPVSYSLPQTPYPNAHGKRKHFDLLDSSINPSEISLLNTVAAVSGFTTNIETLGAAESLPPATRGQGGIPPSFRADLEALAGRMGRKETCIVNAAIMASSWPHKKGGRKLLNKPIVVDVDLPVWKGKDGISEDML